MIEPLNTRFEVRTAQSHDVGYVKELLELNHVKNLHTPTSRANGFVTTDMTEWQLDTLLMVEQGITVAFERDTHKLAGLLIGASWEFLQDWPMFKHMTGILGQYTHNGKSLLASHSYQYGPVCVAEEFRGLGIGEAMADHQRKLFGSEYPVAVTFVNHRNPRSMRFHQRYGWQFAGNFGFNGNEYSLLTIDTL